MFHRLLIITDPYVLDVFHVDMTIRVCICICMYTHISIYTCMDRLYMFTCILSIEGMCKSIQKKHVNAVITFCEVQKSITWKDIVETQVFSSKKRIPIKHG